MAKPIPELSEFALRTRHDEGFYCSYGNMDDLVRLIVTTSVMGADNVASNELLIDNLKLLAETATWAAGYVQGLQRGWVEECLS